MFFNLPCAKKSFNFRTIIWRSPTQPFMKLNVDRASKGNPGEVRVGGIFRDFKGDMAMGFSSY